MSDPITITFRPPMLRDAKGEKTIVDDKSFEFKQIADKSKYEYVTIPERDLFDKPYQGCAINEQKFDRGQTYFLPPAYAKTLRDLIASQQKADMRVFQSHPDVKPIEGNHGPLMTRPTGF